MAEAAVGWWWMVSALPGVAWRGSLCHFLLGLFAKQIAKL
jgi:hypothetical protein